MDILPDYNFTEILIASNVSSAILVFWNIISIVVIIKTKKTPQTARFLTCVLLSTETGGLVVLVIESFVEDLETTRILWHLVFTHALVICSTILIMTVERLVVLTSTHVQDVSHRLKKLKRIAIFIWCSEVVMAYLLRYCICRKADIPRRCDTNNIIRVISVILILISNASCVITYVLLRVKQGAILLNRPKTRAKTTIMLFCYILTHTLCMSLMLLGFAFVPNQTFPVFFQIMNILICLTESLMHVFWFMESRMELLKLLSFLIPKCKNRVEIMRIEIFDIVTYTRVQRIQTLQQQNLS